MHPHDCVSSFTRFVGQVDDLPPDADLGDICMYHDNVYIYTGAGDWEQLASTVTTTEVEYGYIKDGVYTIL